MARNRKIPARKHHGVRDPLKQQEEKEKKLKNVVNNPPVSGNDQQVSKKFAQFMKLAADAKSGKKFKRIHAGREDKPLTKASSSKNPAGGNKFRNIKKFIDETDEDYLKRVNRITSESLKEAQYEAKYGVSVIRDSKTGAITVKKRPKDEIDELLKQKQKEKLGHKVGRKGKKPKETKTIDPKMAKELIKQAIKEDEEEKRKERDGEIIEYKHDTFKFGEVVHGPPNLSTLPRKAVQSETVPRPGKNNLLLKSLLNESAIKSTKTSSKIATKKNPTTITKAQRKGKLKDLPPATRAMLENERVKIVDLYRNLKKIKETNNK